MKHMKSGLKIVLFTLIVLYGMYFSGELLRQKKLYNVPGESVTTWVDEFYDLERNSIDVLFLGTSHSFCSINPSRMFNNSGIISYVLSSSAQDIYASKAYLEEALKYQTPKVVMLEVRGAINTALADEVWNRVAFDNLNHSLHKYSNLRNSIREDESFISYVFPVFRFHDRWKNISEKDMAYVFNWLEKNEGLMGYYPRYVVQEVSMDNYYEEVKDFKIQERIVDAITEMKQICDENNVELFLWKAPTPVWRYDYTIAVEQLAAKLNVGYLDLCQEDLGIVATEDFYDATHLNDAGALKVSDFFSKWLPQQYKLPDQRNNASYVDYKEAYRKYLKNKLISTSDIVKYCSILQDDNYLILFCVNDGISTPTEEYVEALKSLGLKKVKAAAGIKSYIAVVNNGSVEYEEWSVEPLELEYRNELLDVCITSKGYEVGDYGSISIGNVEYMLEKQRGLGIVVYDKIMGCVVDSVTFDIKMGAKAYRK